MTSRFHLLRAATLVLAICVAAPALAGPLEQLCTTRSVTVREGYWCWKGIFHWRCYRNVVKTQWVCSYFNELKSCYGAVERHAACGRGSDGQSYSFSWTDGCVGYYSGVCGGSGTRVFDNPPSVSQGCSSDLFAPCP